MTLKERQAINSQIAKLVIEISKIENDDVKHDDLMDHCRKMIKIVKYGGRE